MRVKRPSVEVNRYFHERRTRQGLTRCAHPTMPYPIQDRSDGQSGHSDEGEHRDNVLECALEMNMINHSMLGDSKNNYANCELISGSGGDSEVSVPVSIPGKRTSPIDGDDLYRLRDRKVLLEDKKRLCALALATALLGILLMIIHAEMCPIVYQPVSPIKLCVGPASLNSILTFLINNDRTGHSRAISVSYML